MLEDTNSLDAAQLQYYFLRMRMCASVRQCVRPSVYMYVCVCVFVCVYVCMYFVLVHVYARVSPI